MSTQQVLQWEKKKLYFLKSKILEKLPFLFKNQSFDNKYEVYSHRKQ